MKEMMKNTNPVILELKNITKSFDNTQVLKGISLSVRAENLLHF